MTSTDGDTLEVRPADLDDVGAMASVLVRSRRAAVPAMPPPASPDEAAPAHVRLRMDAGEAWAATADGHVVGFALVQGPWLDMLYVLPEHAGRGVGSALLDVVKHHRPDGFALWVFESNEPARRFYRQHGLVELERTDGTANEEGCPDIRAAWPGRDPLAYLRAQIDEVDADLATLVARRAALTRAIQHHKSVPGHAGRDLEREQEIAVAMAQRAPVLSVAEWRRIIHEVITVSLDAAERTST